MSAPEAPDPIDDLLVELLTTQLGLPPTFAVTRALILRSVAQILLLRQERDAAVESGQISADLAAFHASERSRLAAEVTRLSHCACGKVLSPGRCGVCDNDE